ncbi:MAG: CD225/dispanin family protein [Pseudoflavonifractor sp.]|nr:CD225/dispanin family protein [Alloprevotella sp.]MCM1116960.1 CD225/dispanin family protein [Pseudoflavonifractor sp.]
MDENKYYVMMGDNRIGPMSLAELRCQPLTPTTPMWRPGMADWAEASTFPELADRFAMPAPPPAPSPAPPYHQPYTQVPTHAPGMAQDSGNIPPMPNNFLVWAILTTILCCLPFGIVALVYSSKVQPKYHEGDYIGAQEAANTAKTWCIVAAIAGALQAIGGFAYAILVGIGAGLGEY